MPYTAGSSVMDAASKPLGSATSCVHTAAAADGRVGTGVSPGAAVSGFSATGAVCRGKGESGSASADQSHVARPSNDRQRLCQQILPPLEDQRRTHAHDTSQSGIVITTPADRCCSPSAACSSSMPRAPQPRRPCRPVCHPCLQPAGAGGGGAGGQRLPRGEGTGKMAELKGCYCSTAGSRAVRPAVRVF